MGESRKWDVRGPWPWRAGLTAPRVSHARAEEDDADAADVSRVPADALHSVEADTFWCVSRLLDGIQVSARGGRGRGLLLGQPTPPGCPARGGVSCDWGGRGAGCRASGFSPQGLVPAVPASLLCRLRLRALLAPSVCCHLTCDRQGWAARDLGAPWTPLCLAAGGGRTEGGRSLWLGLCWLSGPLGLTAGIVAEKAQVSQGQGCSWKLGDESSVPGKDAACRYRAGTRTGASRWPPRGPRLPRAPSRLRACPRPRLCAGLRPLCAGPRPLCAGLRSCARLCPLCAGLRPLCAGPRPL